MKPETTVAIVNVAIVVMIIVCTIVVALITHTASGLWSMLGMFFFMSTSNDDESDERPAQRPSNADHR